MNDPIGKARELAARQRQKTAASATVSDKPAGEQLPLWSEALRGVPNELVRSSLFSARDKREPRRSFRGEDLVVLGDGRINYRGEELRQDDETVWLHVLHLARLHPLGESVEFTPHAFLKAIGWGTSAKEYTRLREHLSRMQATAPRRSIGCCGRSTRSTSKAPRPTSRSCVPRCGIRSFAPDGCSRGSWIAFGQTFSKG